MRAITALGLGATIATLPATLLIHLVQSVLHYGCEFLVGGEAATRSWACSDGIGYLLPGISLVVPIFLAAVLGTIVTFALRARLARRVALGLSAAAPLAWAFVWTLSVARFYLDRHPDSIGVWASAVLPALLISVGGVLVLVLTPVRSAVGDGMLLGTGFALFLVVAAVQPGLIPILAVSAAFAVASTRPISVPSYVLTH